MKIDGKVLARSGGSFLPNSSHGGILLTEPVRRPALGLLALPLLVAAVTALGASPSLSEQAAKSAPIPMDQIGAVAGKQYQGEGLSVTATPEGARLRCAFQKLEGQATREGLWLISTADGTNGERLRVVASAVGRTADFGVRRQSAAATPLSESERTTGGVAASESGVALRFPPHSKALARTGRVEVTDQTARFLRPGVTEEYTVSVDGVRQDFVVAARPGGDGPLRVELAVTGATAAPLANGARLTLDGSGRQIAYNRLRVTDAKGRELAGRMEVAGKDGFHSLSLPTSSLGFSSQN